MRYNKAKLLQQAAEQFLAHIKDQRNRLIRPQVGANMTEYFEDIFKTALKRKK